MAQYRLHRLNGLRLGNLLFDYLWLSFQDHLTVLHKPLHEAGAHHTTIIGYSIIECHRIDRCNLRLITDRHPRQCGLTPIKRPICGLCIRHADIGRQVSNNRKLQVLTNTYTIKTLHIFSWIVTIILIYHIAHANITTHLQSTGHIDWTISTMMPVVVFHVGAMHFHHTTTGIDDVTRVNHTIIKSHQK